MSDLRVVIIDNYDSFVYNLHQRIGELTGASSTVVRNNHITLSGVVALQPTHIVISPGPGNPENPEYFGVSRQVILELGRTTPLLGVCLGHQGIGAAFGGRVIRAPRVMHGKTSRVLHDGSLLYQGIESPTTVMRYHSLMIDPETLPASLVVNSRTDDGLIMGVSHRDYPIFGVQFHPESIGSLSGLRLLRNFLDVRQPSG